MMLMTPATASAPYSAAAGPIQNLHLFRQVERKILGDRERAAGWMPDPHTVEHDQHLVAAGITLHREIVERRGLGAAHEVDAGQVLHQVGQIVVTPLANLLARDDHDVRRRLAARFRLARGGDHRRVDQVFQRQRQQSRNVVAVICPGRRPDSQGDQATRQQPDF
jgi:hypothetical protein